MPRRSTRFANRFSRSSALLALPLVLAAGVAAGGAHTPGEHDGTAAMDGVTAPSELPEFSVPYACEVVPTRSLRDWTLSATVAGWPHSSVVAARDGLEEAAKNDDYERIGSVLSTVERLTVSALPDEERIRIQHAALAVARRVAFVDLPETKSLAKRATLLMDRMALPAATLERMGSEPEDALEFWLGPRDQWVERSTAFCGGDGPLVHESMYGETLAFRPMRGSHARALVAQLVAFDTDGAAHVTPLIAFAELRIGFDIDSPACVVEPGTTSWGGGHLDAVAYADLEPKPPFVLADGEGGVGCKGCHEDADTFDVKDVTGLSARDLVTGRHATLERRADIVYGDILTALDGRKETIPGHGPGDW